MKFPFRHASHALRQPVHGYGTLTSLVPQWHVESAITRDQLDRYLVNGWEPFAITGPLQTPVWWVRKFGDPDLV